ncbi:MAG: molybdopterin converting factor subunit 1 [Dehalococcoidia bacterium]|nr:MAG: molybdopterin converting factor subunit 1 [Dehalococcoidia bacterium]
MKATVKFFAAFHDMTGRRELDLEVREGLTVSELYHDLRARFPRLADYGGSLLFTVNAEYVPADHALHDGDEVAFIPPVSGGTHAH